MNNPEATDRFIDLLIQIADETESRLDYGADLSEIIGEADVVFALWGGEEPGEEIGCLLVKGQPFFAADDDDALKHANVSALWCVDGYQAVGLACLSGDGAPFQSHGRDLSSGWCRVGSRRSGTGPDPSRQG